MEKPYLPSVRLLYYTKWLKSLNQVVQLKLSNLWKNTPNALFIFVIVSTFLVDWSLLLGSTVCLDRAEWGHWQTLALSDACVSQQDARDCYLTRTDGEY